MSCHVLSYRVVRCGVVWCGVVWCGVVSCRVVPCRAVPVSCGELTFAVALPGHMHVLIGLNACAVADMAHMHHVQLLEPLLGVLGMRGDGEWW